MFVTFLINILVPIIAGSVYFLMAIEIRRVGHVRKIMFGEVGYKKVFIAFMLFGIYFITRPLQNIVGPYPWPMIINCARQFMLMAVIAPAILAGIFHWVPNEKGTPKSAIAAAYAVGFCMALIFILINKVAIDGSRLLTEFAGIKIYDAVWFSKGNSPELILIHLISQFISPVGYFLLAAAYVRHRRHNYPLSTVYNMMPVKWKYLESGLLIFAGSLIVSGVAAFFGSYYTYLWVIYFTGAIIAGIIELEGVKIPQREEPEDLKK